MGPGAASFFVQVMSPSLEEKGEQGFSCRKRGRFSAATISKGKEGVAQREINGKGGRKEVLA